MIVTLMMLAYTTMCQISTKVMAKPIPCITVTATAYTADPSENGGNTITTTGKPLRKGVIAVDPLIIPLGTKVYVEGYGYASAEDTGGAIKGHRIDVLIPSRKGMLHWGRKKGVKVYILEWRPKHKHKHKH